MLGKLLKYEIKATYKIFLILSGIMILLGGINRLFIKMKFFQWDGGLVGAVSILQILMIFAIFTVTFVLIIQRYYKNLFKNEGYLSFTLPVKASTHILAKGITAFMWNTVSWLSVIISLFIVTINEDLIEMINQLFIELREPNEYLGNQAGLFIFEVIFIFILSSIVQTLMIYFSISIGQLFNKNKVGMSFVTYFVVYIIQTIITFKSLSIVDFPTESFRIEPFTQLLFPILILVTLVFGILYFLGSTYILKKRLNLQ